MRLLKLLTAASCSALLSLSAVAQSSAKPAAPPLPYIDDIQQLPVPVEKDQRYNSITAANFEPHFQACLEMAKAYTADLRSR